jgi:hypothetical protein
MTTKQSDREVEAEAGTVTPDVEWVILVDAACQNHCGAAHHSYTLPTKPIASCAECCEIERLGLFNLCPCYGREGIVAEAWILRNSDFPIPRQIAVSAIHREIHI